jgi:AcrR family transcriptional regulator
MTELRLIEGSAEPPPSEPEETGAERLPRGRHGIPADLVRSHQRQRLLEAGTAALAEQGYGRVTATRVTELARVSSRTFYQHFEDLWACLLAAYETEAAHLRKEIESACKVAGEERDAETNSAKENHPGRSRARTGVDAALSFLATEPAVARLLCAEPPPQITALATARRDLAETLAGMLRDALAGAGPTPLPGLEHRLVAAAMALVATRAARGDEFRLHDLKPELRQLLLASL